MPKAETVLRLKLKNKQRKGFKFRRQYSVNKYIVDFYCPELKLAIEVDGDSHYFDSNIESDKKRQEYIESQGIHVLRFTNDDVYKNLDEVLSTIEKYIEKNEHHPQPPPREPRRGKENA
jgi:very-short-patch-repair endonuclease